MNCPIEELPDEMLLSIFSFVSHENVFTLLWVCVRWRELCAKLRVKNVKWINNNNITYQKFCVMLGKFGSIESISLQCQFYGQEITDSNIIKLINCHSNMKSLELCYCYKLTDGITKIAEG